MRIKYLKNIIMITNDKDILKEMENYLVDKKVIFVSLEGNDDEINSKLLSEIQKNNNTDKNVHIVYKPTDGLFNKLRREYKDEETEHYFYSLLFNYYANLYFSIMSEYLKLEESNNEKALPMILISERSLLSELHVFTKFLTERGLIRDIFYRIYSQQISQLEFFQDVIIYLRDSEKDNTNNDSIDDPFYSKSLILKPYDNFLEFKGKSHYNIRLTENNKETLVVVKNKFDNIKEFAVEICNMLKKL